MTPEQQRLDLLREIELVNARILEMNRAAATASGSERTALEGRIAQHEGILRLNREQLAVLNSIKNKTLENLRNFDSIDDTIASIGNTLQNNASLQGTFNTKLDAAKTTLTSVAAMVEASTFDDRQLGHIDAAGKAYANMNTSIASAASNLQNGRISQQEYNEIVKQSVNSFDELLSAIDTSTQAGQDLVEVFRRGREEMDSFVNAAERSTAALDAMNGAVDQFGSSGIPLAREFSTALGDIVNTGKLGKAALIALGAAAGKLAYDYFGAGTKASIKAANDVKQTQIDGARDVASAQNDLAFAAQQSASDFGFQLQSMAAQFNAASKTALFGKGLGSVGYAASQLQLAGISAETIATATTAASKAGSGSTKLAADMAIFSERSGISVDNLANVQQAFKLLDGVSAGTALNMAEGTRAMAEQAGLNVGDIMNEVASASEMALSYQIQSGDALARQVVFAKSLGVSFNEVAKAGQSMVLNYKDSIKAEMSLSAMLGKNVDLSEVRAKFASGDTDGALAALQAQGLDPSQMNMFQQQQLQSALGGMDLNTLQKIATPGYQEDVGKVGTLEEKSAKASNDAYLTLKQSAASALATQEAMIAGQKAVADAALQTIKTAAFQNSAAYTQYLADSAKLDIERMFSENLGGAIAAGIGGALANFLPNIFKMFKGGGAPGVPGGGGIMKTLTGPMSKMAKVGGAGLGGILSGGMAFMEKKEEGGSTGEAAGAALIQGGLAAGGAALGAAFGGPLGMMVGGFLGDTLGGWINDYAPGIAENFGKLWDSVGEKFSAIGDAFRPVIENVDNFLKSIGFEEGLGSIFSFMAEYVGTILMQPFNQLLSVFGFIFDIVAAFGQLLSGDVAGALQTIKQGFLDMIYGVLSPMVSLFETIYNGFAKMWNGIADSYIGQQIGLGKMEQKDFSGELAKVTNQTEAAATKSVSTQVQQKAAVEANKPVVAATTAATVAAEQTAAYQAELVKDMTYSGDVQNKMVALLGASAILLEEIVYNTAGTRTISLDGKVLNKKLLDNSSKTYGLAKV
jgi:hypothetical protein